MMCLWFQRPPKIPSSSGGSCRWNPLVSLHLQTALLFGVLVLWDAGAASVVADSKILLERLRCILCDQALVQIYRVNDRNFRTKPKV